VAGAFGPPIGTLMGQRFDLRKLATAGEPVPVSERIDFFSSPRNGVLVLARQEQPRTSSLFLTARETSFRSWASRINITLCRFRPRGCTSLRGAESPSRAHSGCLISRAALTRVFRQTRREPCFRSGPRMETILCSRRSAAEGGTYIKGCPTEAEETNYCLSGMRIYSRSRGRRMQDFSCLSPCWLAARRNMSSL